MAISAGMRRLMGRSSALQRQAMHGQLEGQEDTRHMRDDLGFILSDEAYATITGKMDELKKSRSASLANLAEASAKLAEYKPILSDDIWKREEKKFIDVKVTVPAGVDDEGATLLRQTTYRLPKKVIDYYDTNIFNVNDPENPSKAQGKAALTGSYNEDGTEYIIDAGYRAWRGGGSEAGGEVSGYYDTYWSGTDAFLKRAQIDTKKAFMKKIDKKVKAQNAIDAVKVKGYKQKIADEKAAIAALEAADAASISSYRQDYEDLMERARQTALALDTNRDEEV